MVLQNDDYQSELSALASESFPLYTVWTGTDWNSLSQLTNCDRSLPYVRLITAREDSLLALDNAYTVETAVYRVTYFGSEPDSNAVWAIEEQQHPGIKKLCDFNRFERRGNNSYYWLFLSRRDS
jgi:hypothetical protein